MVSKVPRTHIRLADAAQRLSHSSSWVRKRIADGSLDGFKWSRRDLTVSVESIVRFEEQARVTTQPSRQ